MMFPRIKVVVCAKALGNVLLAAKYSGADAVLSIEAIVADHKLPILKVLV